MLSHFLISELFIFLMIFCRVGTGLMLMPGFGEAFVPVRVRLLLALVISATLTPFLPSPPPVPVTVFGVFHAILAEILVGLFLGGLTRLMISAIHMAGMIIAYQSSLASALTQDIAQSQGQGTSLGNLLGMTAIVLLFVTDLHHYMLKGLADSYTLFPPGQLPIIGDISEHATQTMSGAFHMAMQIAAPSVVVGMMLYLAAGIISRLMPNIQIFFLMMAPQLLLSFFILMVTFSAMMMWYMNYFKDSLSAFLAH